MNKIIKKIKNKVSEEKTKTILNKKNENKDISINIEKESNLINNKQIKIRSPIITIMGHVDHGKTTLINYIKNTEKNKIEHGGITQHINYYRIKTKYGFMTFLDTPGHAAFNSIRCRGIKCTDIVLIVIAADDGIMPQTIEAINLAKKSNLPIIIAINKIDKIKGKNDKIINELAKYGIVPENWGGDILFSFISAKTGEGIDKLLEQINLQAEMLNLKSDFSKKAVGIIIDTKIDHGKGFLTSLIIIDGTLKKGDIIVCGSEWGKVKLIIDHLMSIVNESYPSCPVDIVGLSNLSKIGDKFVVVNNEKEAKLLIDSIKEEKVNNKNIYDISNLILEMKKEKNIKINIILKTDVQGSIEVLKEVINNLNNEKIEINIIKSSLGVFNKSDIDLAIATKSSLLGFNVKYDYQIKKKAQLENIKINNFNTIYEIIDYLKNIIESQSKPQIKENITGIAEIKKIFKYENDKLIAGCVIKEGIIKKNSNIKIIRKNIIIHEGNIESIKIFKDNINEIKEGSECGIIIKNYDNFKINDQIKAYEEIEEK